MYHCHFEDVEHVQMGMSGMVWVRPRQNAHPVGSDPVGTKYAYNDGDGSTRYDREFGIIVTELWSAAHYRDAHIQVSDWTDFDASFWLMNGRAYPDTLAPNGASAVTRPDGGLQYRPDLDHTSGRLQYQPNSSHITCMPGEKVLVRLASLGFQDHSLTCDDIDLTVIAEDASLLRNGAVSNYQTTNTVDIGPGESRDVIFTAPAVGEYLFYDRRYSFLNNGGGTGYGGMMTTISVVPPGTLPAQTQPNL